MESVTLDALDLRLLHALQLDGRAPFSRIAEVLDVSDRTVARRFGKLRAAGIARIAGVTNSHRLGHAEWLVRLRVPPARSTALARALAHRPDTAWVAVLSSGTEIGCVFRVAGEGPAPLAALGRLPYVGHVEAHRVLRPVMERRWSGRNLALTDAQIAALTPEPAADPAPVELTDLDRRLLPALATDGRAAYPDLARRIGWSESAVRRRLHELRRMGVLQLDVEIDSGLFGFSVQCMLRLSIAPGSLAQTARALAEDAEAAFVGTMTGSHNLVAVAVCRDAAALDTYLTERVGTLGGVERVESALVTAYFKRAAPEG
ncbi:MULTISPECIES: Lrp/AsnC family transcriptional regulator [unclassified Streptomyces]|uniref:Lrp/AsnC family transcriptional regulator n=1 Tax=unclassified Streptomyces TaxID=2593676 RepID=UPI000366BCB7|nr:MULTISPECIES: Lrp/AsnC family transcriptional regulator [unclassified Streptomyces]MYQ78852.1 AsnC family transcriptional regulator [Streptomyces sp. SID4923]